MKYRYLLFLFILFLVIFIAKCYALPNPSTEQIQTLFDNSSSLPSLRGLKPGVSTRNDVAETLDLIPDIDVTNRTENSNQFIWQDKKLSITEEVLLENNVIIYIGVSPYDPISLIQIIDKLGNPDSYSIKMNYYKEEAIDLSIYYQRYSIALKLITPTKSLNKSQFNDCSFNLELAEIDQVIMVPEGTLVSTNIKGRFNPLDNSLFPWRKAGFVKISDCIEQN